MESRRNRPPQNVREMEDRALRAETRLAELQDADRRAKEAEAKAEAAEKRAEKAEREIARLERKNETLSAAMHSGREESRLEVKRPMLLAMGDALARAHAATRPDAHTIAGIETAIRAGGATTYGTPGEHVGYDQKRHHANEATQPPTGAVVEVMAPGVEYGTATVLKATVKPIPRANGGQ